MRILDRSFNLVPPGVAGELCISGTAVGRGYLNRPELTFEKFIADPYWVGKRLYRTGDLACWSADGNIEFLGRLDNQVKIRGFRIELGEIENELLNHDRIKEAAAAAKKNQKGENYLCAYIISEVEIPGPELRSLLLKHLPRHMVPLYFVRLDKLPLTTSGKVNRKVLPEPERDTAGGYAAPRNEVEKKLAEIWSEVLGIEIQRTGIDANFFESGGHSLNAITLIGKLHKAFNVKLALKELFETPTIKGIAAAISTAEKTTFIDLQKIEKREFYKLSYNQKRLWILNQMQPESSSYVLPARIELKHNVDEGTLKKALYQVIQRHDSLRTGFKIVDDEPVQYVETGIKIPIKKIDISSLKESERQKEREQFYAGEQKKPFNLSEIPLFRVVLLKLSEEDYDLIFNIHHIIADGWSMEILKDDFLHYYEKVRNGKEYETMPLKIQYKDFAAWHNKMLGKGWLKEQSDRFWKERFGEEIPGITLAGNLRGNRNDRSGAGYKCMLDKETTIRLKKVARDNNTTLFTILFPVYLILLSRLSGREDVVCSIIAAGREHMALYNVVGFFINSILFRGKMTHEESFIKLLQRVKIEVLEIFQHQDYPLELVFKELKMKHPDVAVSFNMLNMQDLTSRLELDVFAPRHVEDVQDVKFDIEIYITEYKNGISLDWRFKKSLYSPTKITYIVGEYNKFIDFFTRNLHKSYGVYKRTKKSRSFKRMTG
jgi:acyl carrier protein